MKKYLTPELWPLLFAIGYVGHAIGDAGIPLRTGVLMLTLETLVPVALAIWYGSSIRRLAEEAKEQEGKGCS